MDLPRAMVFSAASDFAAVEARLSERGVEVTRVADRVPPGAGIAWTARARLRGRVRDIATELEGFDPPQGLSIRSRIGGMTVMSDARFVALAAGRTRVIVGLDMRADTLKARLVLQALRLGKARLRGRLERTLSAWADAVVADQRRRGSAG